MNKLDRANKYTADKCGVEIGTNNSDFLVYETEVTHCYEWTIEDARCREIVREKFGIGTQQEPSLNNWYSHYVIHGEGVKIFKYYATPAEAEIACILSIVEQEVV